jgi:hypothetical protein
METQARYWKEYNTNLESLSERSRDIEGLSELLASFADGSEDSVNMIAGLAMATEGELKGMVDTWQVLKAEQQTVAESLAQLETDFAASMATMQSELESTIEEMNLSEEAAESGRTTIEGFVRGTESMLPAVSAAYARIAQAAVAAIDLSLQIESPPGATQGRFVGEVVHPDSVQAALRTSRGVTVMNADHQKKPISVIQGATNASHLGNPNIEISYNITGVGSVPELESMLSSRDASLKETIIETLKEYNENQLRVAYN